MKRIALGAALLSAAALTYSACTPEMTGQAQLAVTARPRAIDDLGQTAVIEVTATDAAGKPGTGSVSLTSPAGSLKVGTTVMLDASGKATAMFSCEAAQDTGCKNTVRVSAEWTTTAGKLTGSVSIAVGPQPVTGDGGMDGGTDGGSGGFDAGTLDSLQAQCMGSANVLYLNGAPMGFVHVGSMTIDQGAFTGTQLTGGTKASQVLVIPAMAAQGTSWSVQVAPPTGASLAEQVYLGAVRSPTSAAAGLDVSGNGRGCNVTSGTFKVFKYQAQGTTLQELGFSFQQSCEGQASNLLTGCLYFKGQGTDGGIEDGGATTRVLVATTKAALVLGTNDSLEVIASVTSLDGGGPIQLAPVSFSTSRGAFGAANGMTTATGTTDDAGVARVQLFGGTGMAGTATIQAQAGDGTGQTTVNLVAVASLLNENDPSIKTVLGIQSSNRETTTPVLFRVVDANNQPVPGVGVTFTRSGAANTSVTPNGVSNMMGIVGTTLQAGDSIGTATVTATVTATIGQTTPITVSRSFPIVGGKPSDRGFVVTCEKKNLPALHVTGGAPPTRSTLSTCSARMADRFSNPVGVPTTVQWFTERGSVPPTSISPGGAQMNAEVAVASYNSASSSLPNDLPPLANEPSNGNKNPRDMLITVMAVTAGEEDFYDGSGPNGQVNGKWDPGEWFVDLPEPYVDANDNGRRDPGEDFLDTTRIDCSTGMTLPPNGTWDGPNGCWDANTQIFRHTHVRWSGPLIGPITFAPPQPWVVAPSPSTLTVSFVAGDEYMGPMSNDSPQLSAQMITPRGSVQLNASGLGGDDLGMNILYDRVEAIRSLDGGFDTVVGPCNETATTSTAAFRCIRRYTFPSFSQGNSAQMVITGGAPQQPLADGGVAPPTMGTIRITAGHSFSTPANRDFNVTLE